MEGRLGQRAGRALVWKTVELGGSRLLGLVRTLILARLLVPDDFGLLAIGAVSLEVGISLTNFGMRQALIQRRAPTSREYDSAWTFELLRAVTVCAVLFVAAPLIAIHLFAEPRAIGIIRVIALTPVVSHLSSIREVDLHRALDVRPLVAIALSGAAAHMVVAIVLAPLVGVWALVLGLLAGTLVQTGVSYVVAPHVPRIMFDREAARPLFEFGRWVFVTAVLDVAGSAVLQAVVGRRLGAAELGLYFVARRLAFFPRQVVEALLGQVAFPLHAALQGDPVKGARAFRAAVSAMWILLAPLYAVVIALTPELVELLAGAKWVPASGVIRVLAVASLVSILADATVPLLQGRGRTRGVAGLRGVRSLVVVTTVWWLVGAHGVVGAALAWLAAETAAALWSAAPARRLLPRPYRGIPARLGAIGSAAAAGAGVALALHQLLPGTVGLLLSAAAGPAAAAALVWVVDRRLHLGLAEELEATFPRLAPVIGVHQRASGGP